MPTASTILADGWVFVGRTDGLTEATRGCQVAQAAEALRRASAAVRWHGADPAAMRLRWIVPCGAGWDAAVPASVVPVQIAAGLLPPGVLIQVEARAPL